MKPKDGNFYFVLHSSSCSYRSTHPSNRKIKICENSSDKNLFAIDVQAFAQV